MTDITMRTGLFKAVGKAMSLHASNDKARPALTCIHFDRNEIAATNSYTLAVWTPNESWELDEPFDIECKPFSEALKTIKTDDKSDMTLSLRDRVWKLGSGSVSVAGILRYVDYPNWRPLITTASETTFGPTGFNSALFKLVGDASLAVSKKSPLEIVSWLSPLKPMLFRTETPDGVLTQLIMPMRLPSKSE